MYDFEKLMSEVAKALLGEPSQRLTRGDRWRYGSKGSMSVDVEKGQWFDFENDRGGGVLELIESELQTDRRGALAWMRENGYLPGRIPGRSKARSGKPSPKHGTGGDRKGRLPNPKPDNEKSDTFRLALKLWNESEKIDERAEHPFRRWAKTGDKPNVLYPWCAVPAGIRWNPYRGGVIVAGVFPISAWGKDGIPSGDPVAVQALAIDGQGKNRYVLGKNRDLRRCSYGPISAGVLLLGDPTSERVNVVEGVADALAVYSRAQGVVVASLGSPAKLANQEGVIDWLVKRDVWLYPDNDENKAGDKAVEALVDAIKERSPDAVVRKPNARAYDDPGDWAERTPFPMIERYDFDEKSGIFFDSGLPWGEAERMAIQSLWQ